MSNIKRVILDTNFIIDMFKFGIDFSDIEDFLSSKCNFVVVEQTSKELEKVGTKYSKVAMDVIKSGSVTIVDSPGSTADDAIISLSSKNSGSKFVVATNDMKLRKRLKDHGVQILYIRARKRLGIMS